MQSATTSRGTGTRRRGTLLSCALGLTLLTACTGAPSAGPTSAAAPGTSSPAEPGPTESVAPTDVTTESRSTETETESGGSTAGNITAATEPSTTGATNPETTNSETPDSESTTTAQPDPPVPDTPDGNPKPVVGNLELPWSVVFLNDTPLVSERDSGRILELDQAGQAREVGVVDGIDHGGEGGLLGLALDQDNRLYAYSTGEDGNRIQRIALTGKAGSYALGRADTILDGLPKAGNHNGGRIEFGPDGMLYAGVGDAGERDSAQNVEVLSGKILRMTPDGEVPPDNPFPDSLVYSFGHRNVQGIAWAADGTMFATEFGQNTWDELNIIEPGANYGWPTVEGIEGAEGFVDPVQQWAPADASPSGIAVIGDTLYIANLRGERLRAVPVADPAQATEFYTQEFGRIRDVALAPDGALWFLSSNTGRDEPRDGDDHIYRVALSRG